jgi:hypothetical protein
MSAEASLMASFKNSLTLVPRLTIESQNRLLCID